MSRHNILLKFRSYAIGIVADIEKAFYQIVIDPKNRNMLRFLWFDNVGKENPVTVQYQFCRLVFGLTPSPAILTGIINHHLTRYLLTEPTIVETLSNGFYVDDFTCDASSVEEGFNIYQKAKHLMNQGGFNLHKWKTNSRILQQRIDAVEGEAVNEMFELKLLGVSWDISKDIFQFDLRDLVNFVKSLLPTKQSILKASAKILDPLGLLSPFVVGIKILFQTLCKNRVDWDVTLDRDMLSQWSNLIQEFERLSEISVPRCYVLLDQKIASQQLHGFCDASRQAYAAVIYLRTEYQNGHVSICVVCSKTRVAPLKEQTILRLELLGATTLSRLLSSLNSGSVLVRSAGISGTTGEENDFPSYHRQIVHLRIIFLTKLRPLIIQYFSLTAANVAGLPSWCTTKCLDRTTSSVNPCLLGSKIGFFIVDGKSD